MALKRRYFLFGSSRR